MDVFEKLPPIVVLVLGFLLIAWLVLVFLVPFMIESIRQSTRKTHEELVELNTKLDRLNSLLSQGRTPIRDAEPALPEKPEPRGRREPTISEPAVRPTGSRNRREPIVR